MKLQETLPGRNIDWDRDRARQCIQEDYLGAVPRFNQDDFKRMFHVSRQNYEKIRVRIYAPNMPQHKGANISRYTCLKYYAIDVLQDLHRFHQTCKISANQA